MRGAAAGLTPLTAAPLPWTTMTISSTLIYEGDAACGRGVRVESAPGSARGGFAARHLAALARLGRGRGCREPRPRGQHVAGLRMAARALGAVPGVVEALESLSRSSGGGAVPPATQSAHCNKRKFYSVLYKVEAPMQMHVPCTSATLCHLDPGQHRGTIGPPAPRRPGGRKAGRQTVDFPARLPGSEDLLFFTGRPERAADGLTEWQTSERAGLRAGGRRRNTSERRNL